MHTSLYSSKRNYLGASPDVSARDGPSKIDLVRHSTRDPLIKAKHTQALNSIPRNLDFMAERSSVMDGRGDGG